MGLKTPVLLIIFNRPDTTQQVFDAIRQAQPRQLFVAADGPREGKDGEAEKCQRARGIVKQIDWDCDVRTLFQEKNLGCGLGPATAISWFFENVEEGIILEDDCLPHPTFFRFCEELLEKYRDDERVMMVTGFNPLGKWKLDIQSYHFSHPDASWGWASWRRSWKYFDIDMKLWADPEVKDRIRDVLCDTEEYNWRKKAFEAVYDGKLDTAWDYQWLFARLLYSGLSAVPCANLVSNIGFDERATHTLNPASHLANLPLYPLSFPLKEPRGIVNDRGYARMYYLKEIRAWRLDSKAIRAQYILTKMKHVLERLFSVIGLKISRTGSAILGNINKFTTSTRDRCKFAPAEEDRFKLIQNMNIKTVIDVGAHEGESALQFHALLPDATIYSFEPLRDCFLILNANMRNVPNFKAFNLALGDAKGRLEMHRSKFSDSSSLLKMASLHKEAFPYSAGEILETVDVNTLDNMTQELDLEDNILLKIDVQGYEHKVIMGSRNILNRIKLIIIETSFHELYEGQPLFQDIYELLFKQGFVYAGSWGELKSPLDGAPLQQDSIFIRKSSSI